MARIRTDDMRICDRCKKTFDDFRAEQRLELPLVINRTPVWVQSGYEHDICAECLRTLLEIKQVEVVKRELAWSVIFGVCAAGLIGRAVLFLMTGH